LTGDHNNERKEGINKNYSCWFSLFNENFDWNLNKERAWLKGAKKVQRIVACHLKPIHYKAFENRLKMYHFQKWRSIQNSKTQFSLVKKNTMLEKNYISTFNFHVEKKSIILNFRAKNTNENLIFALLKILSFGKLKVHFKIL